MRGYIGEIVIGILIAVYILITQVQIWNLQDTLDLTQKVLEWKGICDEDDLEMMEYLDCEHQGELMEILKKHADTVVTLGGLFGAILWINSQFTGINDRFSNMEKDIAVIKAVLIVNGQYPKELALQDKK